MLNKRAQEIILKTALLCSVSGAGFYVGSQTDAQNSIVYAKSVYKTTTVVSMRSGMNNDEKLISKIPSNQAVDILGVYKSGAWAKVRYNSKTGYIRTMYLKLSKTSDTPSQDSSSGKTGKSRQSDGFHMYTNKSVALRKSASSASDKLATLNEGTDFLLIDKKGSYYKVLVNNRYGWISISAASDYGRSSNFSQSAKPSSSSSSSSSSSRSDKSYRSDGYHMVTKQNVNFRSGASADTNKLGTLPAGTDVLIIDKKGDWYKVHANGRNGYVHENYLVDYGTAAADQATETKAKPSSSSNSSTSSNSNSSSQGKSIQSDGYHMYAKRQTVLKRGPGSSYGTRTTLSEGTDLLIIDQQGSYYKVRYNGAYSWVKKADLADYSKGSSGSSDSGNSNADSGSSTDSGSYRPVNTMITKKRVKLLAGPNTDFSSKATLPEGTKVTVLNDWGYFVKVSFNGKDGYIHMKDLKKAAGYKSPSATGNSSGSGSNSGSSGGTTASPQQLGGSRSSAVDIDDLGSYGDTAIKVSGDISGTSVSRVSVFLDGTYLANAKVSGRSFSYKIPSNVIKPGTSQVRIQAATGKGLLYQTESFHVSKTPTIVVDPGHGGQDSGAVGSLDGKSIYEKNYTTKFAAILRNELQSLGFNVVMTRHYDSDVPRASRVAISQRSDADLYFSVHHNGGFPNASGGLTLYPSQQGNPSTQASFSESRKLSQMLGKAYTQAGMNYRGAYKDKDMTGGTLYVLRNTTSRAILTEIGFISNTKDARKITSEAFQKALSKGLAQQVYNFFYD